MRIDHFQEEETYLFSSLLDRLRRLSQKDAFTTAYGISWPISRKLGLGLLHPSGPEVSR